MNLVLFIVLSTVIVLCCYWCGHSHGKQDSCEKCFLKGYEKGRADTEAWIVQLETDVDQAREWIWREKP